MLMSGGERGKSGTHAVLEIESVYFLISHSLRLFQVCRNWLDDVVDLDDAGLPLHEPLAVGCDSGEGGSPGRSEPMGSILFPQHFCAVLEAGTCRRECDCGDEQPFAVRASPGKHSVSRAVHGRPMWRGKREHLVDGNGDIGPPLRASSIAV